MIMSGFKEIQDQVAQFNGDVDTYAADLNGIVAKDRYAAIPDKCIKIGELATQLADLIAEVAKDNSSFVEEGLSQFDERGEKHRNLKAQASALAEGTQNGNIRELPWAVGEMTAKLDGSITIRIKEESGHMDAKEAVVRSVADAAGRWAARITERRKFLVETHLPQHIGGLHSRTAGYPPTE
jgi:hypothetical protein